VAEKTLQIGDVHAQREQPGRNRVAQQISCAASTW
jgi:hypothetical protein